MSYGSVFKRYELKYLITRAARDMILHNISEKVVPDVYPRSVVRNVYYDTDTHLIIRRSIEKPEYKEKLRVRAYARAEEGAPVFVELKKKYKQVVYKRRLKLTEREAELWLSGGDMPDDGQIAREIDYFSSFYAPLRPAMYLSYERSAFCAVEEKDFRVTFDENILCRREELTLDSDPWGEPILPDGRVLMELKCAGGIPLWMTSILSREGIFKTSFSKYGTAYEKLVLSEIKEVNTHA